MSWPSTVRHFSPSGDPGLHDPDGTRMDADLMMLLDAMREEVGLPFIITSGWRSEDDQHTLTTAGLSDAQKSAHLTGEGVDGYFQGLPLQTAFAVASQWPWQGMGLYPYTTPPVLHLDVKQRAGSRSALWLRDRINRYHYAPGKMFRTEFGLLIRGGLV
jgi:uncharacterized protein YcbK (DUF882 family)